MSDPPPEEGAIDPNTLLSKFDCTGGMDLCQERLLD